MAKHMVLGGGGFIGSHLCKRLSEQGHSVVAVDIEFPEYRSSQWSGSDLVLADLRKSWLCCNTLEFDEPDVVWQLAADMGGVEYFHSDHDWQAAVNNQLINVNVMNALATTGLEPRVIFTSTACALATENQTHEFAESFGDVNPGDGTVTLTEEDILWGTPDQLYGQEKRNSAFLWQAAPLDTRVCFLHTVYGPYQEHAGIKMKFPSAVCQKARKARETGKIELFGDGRQVRTYLYIDDAVDRLLALGASDTDPGFLNIGGVTPYSVDEVARIAASAAGLDSPPFFGGISLEHIPGPTGVEARSCDMKKFNDAFPEIAVMEPFNATLEEGMKRFINWLDEVDG